MTCPQTLDLSHHPAMDVTQPCISIVTWICTWTRGLSVSEYFCSEGWRCALSTPTATEAPLNSRSFPMKTHVHGYLTYKTTHPPRTLP